MHLSIIVPARYIGNVMELVTTRRGSFKEMTYLDEDRVQLNFEMPLGEVIIDFYDQLKSRTQGYASLDYTFNSLLPADLVKLDVLVNGVSVDALSIITHRDEAYTRGRDLVNALRRLIPRPDVRCADSGVDWQPHRCSRNRKGHAQECPRQVLRRRHLAQAQAARKAKRGQGADEDGGKRRDPAGSLYGRAELERQRSEFEELATVRTPEQVIAGEELLRRIEGAPFTGPMLDVAPTRRTKVIGLNEGDVPAVMQLLERAFGPYEAVNARPDDDLRFELELSPLAQTENWRSAQRLHEIIAFLRSPEGCPWDRAQNWQSLAPKVVEEAYEVLDAIADGDAIGLAGELGDLLLIVALLTQIAEEQGSFTIEDVYETVNRKLIRRHPHVFGDEAADTPEAVLSTWHRVKREERGATSKSPNKYDRLPKSMPAISKAVVMREDAGDLATGIVLPDGATLLAMIEAAIFAGRDPEAELQAALEQKYATN